MQKCTNKDCCASTGICGSITFGTGKLDDYGYWEFPCAICEKAFDEAETLNYNNYIGNSFVEFSVVQTTIERITFAVESEYEIALHEKMQARLGRKWAGLEFKNGKNHITFEGKQK